MASPKAWYWLGLGVLALSFITSGTGRSIMSHASSYVACIRARALPYVGAVELALGRTQAGYRHLQVAGEQHRAQLEMERARIEAAQAMLQDRRMQVELRRAQELWSNRVLTDGAFVADHVTLPPDTIIPSSIEIMDSTGRVVVCPRNRVRVAAPAVHVEVAPTQEPI